MPYVGIDQALGKTGVCVLSDAGEVIHLSVVSPKSLVGAPRLASIRDQLRNIVSLYAVKHAALEGYAYEANGRVFDLGEIGGVVRLLLHDLGIPFSVVAPAQLKKVAGCAAAAEKEKVRAAVNRKWHIDIPEDNECDAFVLAQVAKTYVTGDSSDRGELEVVAKLKAPKDSGTFLSKGKIRISI